MWKRCHLERLRRQGADVVGCDLSLGMLRAASGPRLVNADALFMPLKDCCTDVILAAHMLYHVAAPIFAVAEMRRVLLPGGKCVVVTNGLAHIASLRRIVESVVRESTPGWRMSDWATRTFSLDEGAEILRTAFDTVACVRPPVKSEAVITDADVAADYIASVADAYESEVACSWADVVDGTRRAVASVLEKYGAFITSGVTGAFMCA